jgi:hypothetical protein
MLQANTMVNASSITSLNTPQITKKAGANLLILHIFETDTSTDSYSTCKSASPVFHDKISLRFDLDTINESTLIVSGI